MGKRYVMIMLGALSASSLMVTSASAQDGLLGVGQGVMSLLGITAPEAPAIEYRERPPLVVPPKSTLPSPQQREDARRGNWPNDPDIERRRAATADGRTPATEREKYRLDRNPVLSNQELAAGRGGTNARTRYGSAADNSVSELLYEPQRANREADALYAATGPGGREVPVGQDAPRRTLSEPPTGYRRATQRVAPGPQEPRRSTDSTGQREFVLGQPTPQ